MAKKFDASGVLETFEGTRKTQEQRRREIQEEQEAAEKAGAADRRKKSVNFTFRISQELRDQLDEASAERGWTITQLLTEFAREGLKNMKKEK